MSKVDTQFLPPWHMVMLDGELGPEYGPRSLSAYERACADYNASVEGGGFWDFEKEQPRWKGPPRTVPRHDEDEVHAWVRRHGHKLPTRELETYCLYWVDRYSASQCARRLSVTEGAVKSFIGRIRARVKESIC